MTPEVRARQAEGISQLQGSSHDASTQMQSSRLGAHMSTPPASRSPTGSVDVALAHAQRLLPGSPVAAAEQASEVLKVVPTHPAARLILGSALGLMGQGAAAVDT